MDLADIHARLLDDRPHLFSAATVEVSSRDMASMAELVAAIEEVVALEAYREHVLTWAPEIARYEPKGKGVFFGYDFHLAADGPRLIEINTNAGGALLAAAQAGGSGIEESFVAMFRAELGGDLKALAIVDEAPESQYLYPEFLLCKALFERHEIEVVICDPQALMLCHGGLWHEQKRLDLVYNRLTDFALAAPEHAALRQAYLDGAVVVTPHPRAHALYADKRNLVSLCDEQLLRSWGVATAAIEVLMARIPRTERVTSDRAEDFWARRRGLFFKPAGGYGSKAAYRGDKITRRVFDEVLAGDYVAQALVPPSTVAVTVENEAVELKADIRCYAYDGKVQLVAARLWQGQTTNFRTPGGGFAKVVTV
jgi:hypothetical protein